MKDISFTFINVSSLSKRLEPLVGWGFQIYALQEVRASLEQQKSIARRARACNMSIVFSAPPKPSPTFTTSPGGTAIMVREPLGIRQVFHPLLQEWVDEGRAVAAIISVGRLEVMCLSLYGFPKGHPRQHASEDLLSQCFHWASGVNLPLLLGGDLNSNPDESTSLSLSDMWKLYRITDDSPTTRSRSGGLSSNSLDHVLANCKMLDANVTARVSHFEAVSDHFPVVGSFRAPEIAFMVTHWPRVPRLPSLPCAQPEWAFAGSTFVEWSICAERWVSEAFAVKVPPKLLVHSAPFVPPRPQIDRRYASLRAAYRLVKHLSRCDNNPHAWSSLAKKLHALRLSMATLPELARAISLKITEHMQEVQKGALDAWRQKTRVWKGSDAAIFRFLRNPPPPKSAAISMEGGLSSLPGDIFAGLQGFWGSFENWSSQQAQDHALEVVEDIYGVYVPSEHVDIALTPELLKNMAKDSKNSTAGLDAWSLAEVKSLPAAAWGSFLQVIQGSKGIWSATMPNLCRRIPLEKGDALIPTPDGVRAIDLFSALLRVYSKAQVSCLLGWRSKILHRTQYASQGGTLPALARYAYYSEKIIQGDRGIWGLSLDFQILFNCVDPRVAQKIAVMGGMTEAAALSLVAPIVGSRKMWRLPFQASSPPMASSRGLPQGLCSSVLLSELFLSTLIRRLNHVEGLETIGYVDDISIVTTSEQSLRVAFRLVREFETDFEVSISREKCALWGSEDRSLGALSLEWAIPMTDAIHALGMEWPLKGTRPDFKKENDRLAKAKQRMVRLRHVSSAFGAKWQALNVGCLALTDYAAPPSLSGPRSLSPLIKRALAAPFGASEIVLNIGGRSSLDPSCRWALTQLRLWVAVSKMPDACSVLDKVTKSRRLSRFSCLLRLLHGKGWELDRNRLVTLGEEIRFSNTWQVIRSRFVMEWKKMAWRQLALRRPLVFDGLDIIDVSSHAKLLAEMDSYHVTTLLRVWAGCPMTRAHRFTVGLSETPLCQCENESQSIAHLLFRCPLSPPPPLPLSPLRSLPTVSSQALLLLQGSTQEVKRAWKCACKSICRILSSRDGGLAGRKAEPSTPLALLTNTKGHALCMDSTGTYAFCGRCFITRVKRDAHFILTKACLCPTFQIICEGDYLISRGHKIRMTMQGWKRASMRPSFGCLVCGFSVWATKGFSSWCPGVPTA